MHKVGRRQHPGRTKYAAGRTQGLIGRPINQLLKCHVINELSDESINLVSN